MTGKRAEQGFTLAELLVVLLIVGLIAAIAVPNIQGAMVRAEETALRQNLSVMRKALDDFAADKGVAPQDLNDLVEERYIQFIPDDPVAEDQSEWQLVRDDDRGIIDLRSGSNERGRNGVAYNEW